MRPRNLTLILFAAMAIAVAGPGASQASAAGLLRADGPFGGTLKVTSHQVNATINNGIAVVEVDQTFQNAENRIVEALYTFPVPHNASVANFSMWINGKEMIGEVVEKERARAIYNSYKQQPRPRDPGLLEQTSYKRFDMRIFPIPPRGEQRVRITYYQELDVDENEATFVYPLATMTETGLDADVTGRFSMSLHVKSEIPITSMASPSHADDFVIVEHGEHYRQASLETGGGDLNRDLVIAIGMERPRTGIDLIASRADDADGYFQLTLSGGKELAQIERGMDYVFVMDISGSMAADGKLRTSNGAVAAFTDVLGEQNRVEVITFNVAPNTLFGSLSPVNDETRRRATEFLSTQQARGGTVLRPAMEAAYRYADPDRTLNVIVLSDGMTEQSEQRQLLELIGQRPTNSRVFCIGVGNEVNRPLLDQLARQSGGLAAFISAGDDFQRHAQMLRRKLQRPAATNVKFTFGGENVYDVEPRTSGNLYYGMPMRLYGRYRKAGPITVTMEAEVLGQPLKQILELTLPERDEANPEIERMWAYRRVKGLMDDDRASGSSGNREQIVKLCETYSIAGEHASFIVLENDGEYRRWKVDQRNAMRLTRDRRAQRQVRERLEQMRQRTVAQIGPVETTNAKAADAKPQAADPAAAPRTDSDRGVDIDLPSIGGGAIDPVSGTIVLILVGSAAVTMRRRRK